MQSLITNYGDDRKITGVHNSLATNDRQSITFLEGFNVTKLYREEDSGLVKVEHLLQLDLDSEFDRANDAYLLDEVVAVRVNETEFRFFTQPLVRSLPVKPIAMAPFGEGTRNSKTDETDFDYSKFFDLSFAPNKGAAEYTLFGIRDKQLVKIVYEIEEDSDGEFYVTHNITTKEDDKLDGEHPRLEVTDELLIVTSSDGNSPGVFIFDHEWNLIKDFSLLE